MRAYEIQGEFGLENLKLVQRRPAPVGAGQVRLKMRFVSLNYRDLLMVQGKYNPRQPLPLIPCSDGVGEVVELGEGVDRKWLGRRVAPVFFRDWMSGEPTHSKLRSSLGGPLDGTLASEMVVPVESVVEVPSHLSDAEGATLTCAAVTAWSAIVEQGNLKPGQTLLTLGTGGVSLFAVQFGAMMGAEVIVTSSSDEKLARAMELGAIHGINYRREPKWGRAARELTAGRGVDLVVELGGAGTLERSIRALRPGGQISLIGVLAGGAQELNVVPVLMQNIRIQGVIVGHKEMYERMNQAISQARLRPVIDKVYGFDEAPRALKALGEGAHMGKICVEIA